MSFGALQETVTYRDAKGRTARVLFYVANSGTLASQAAAAGAVIVAMDALTNAARQTNKGPATEGSQEVVYGAASPFLSIEDKAIFTFQAATGAIHRFQVPAPKDSIFLADGETVDATNTDVVAFVSAVTANATSRNGEAVSFGAFGTRIRRKTQRRLNIFIKDPSLTEPAE